MHKYLLFFFTFVVVSSVSSQINDLTENDWQLMSIFYAGVNYTPPANVNSNIDFENQGGQIFASGEGVVNSFFGNVEVDEVNNTISFTDFSITLADCDQPECWFETLYFFDMMSDQGAPKAFTFGIVYLGNSGSLELTDSDGNVAFYWDGNMSAQDFGKTSLTIHPNPAKETLYVNYIGELPESITVYDISGKLLLSQGFEKTLNIADLKTGIYFIEISSSEGRSVQKFVKK